MKKRTIGLAAGMMLGAMVMGMSCTAFAAGTTLDDAQKTALAAAGKIIDQDQDMWIPPSSRPRQPR